MLIAGVSGRVLCACPEEHLKVRKSIWRAIGKADRRSLSRWADVSGKTASHHALLVIITVLACLERTIRLHMLSEMDHSV